MIELDMQKKVAIFLKLPQITDYPFSEQPYFDSYNELSAQIEAQGAECYIVRSRETYLGNGSFSKSWQFRQNQLIETGPIIADVVFDRGEFKSDNTVPVLNQEKVNHICTDKWAMYQRFPQFCPRTWRVTDKNELTNILATVATDLVVLKPIDGEGGNDVFIGSKADAVNHAIQAPFLVQEFIDSSGGVPGFVEGLHDFRVATLNGQLVYSYYRTPPQDSYLANVARGGSFQVVPVDKIPSAFVAIVREIDQEFVDCPNRFYGVDFALTAAGPKIIEMNSRLGLLPNRDDEAFVTLKSKLATTLLAMAQ